MNKPIIKITDFTYSLPQEKIASYPLQYRDQSKLLIYNKGIVSDTIFSSLPDLLSEQSLMVFNNTKVVPARLLFRKESGAFIEIFCLEPYSPNEYNLSFGSHKRCSWKSIIGNVKRWKSGSINLYIPENDNNGLRELNLTANLLSKDDNCYIVNFTWSLDIPFSQVLDLCGKIPIPPYLKRETETIDKERYQTLYAKYRGSVAAPTAGLHFTQEVLSKIDSKGIDREELCLHVGAGTFLPVKSEYIGEHIMHSEPFSVTKTFLSKLYEFIGNGKIISVGTTSTRSIESLYFLGLQCHNDTPEKWIPRPVLQWDPYNVDSNISPKESIYSLLRYMEINNKEHLELKTQIIIVPSYSFKFVDILITNFHQPQSTLLLLIAAFVGEDNWHNIYDYALNNNFRFLSYGDSSLLIR